MESASYGTRRRKIFIIIQNIHIQKDYLYELMDKNFTKEELDILILKQQGYSTHEIAQQYQYSVRKIRYILRKIKKWVQVH